MVGNELPDGDREDGALERLLTIPQAARVLAVPESWLRERVRLRRVPHRRLGKHVRFSSADLELIVERAAQQVVVPARRTFYGRQGLR
ncbi:helix-turn-helix domain-containing protein [Nocardiopsis sp. EMB25]|uniref:helix-turn-helix domain-containing protein n=1 Tax=Nocardiopsis sp. EMB25 TaxID=2835867 RepID=UPI0022847409|nr:helix-turn-helix domain-containing protein [Nocardiopsis sp. EMB25]MCY9782564.1 helix-turn-helix domain-containing protein [Nocardiopsis sp. EMB25]